MPAKNKAALVVLALVVLILGGFASVQGATLLPGRWLPGDDLTVPAAGDQVAPAVSRGDNMYLVVWADERSDPIGILTQEYETSSDIYAMRLDANGDPLDAVPFPIIQAPAAQTNPRVSWNGENWLVVWDDWGLSGTGYYYSRYIRAARVSPAGAVLDNPPITAFTHGSSSGAMVALANDGADWALVTQGTSSGENDIVGVRISADGSRLDIAPKIIVPGTYYLRYDLRLAYANGIYLLAWEDRDDIQAMRLDQALQPVDGEPFTLVAGNNGSVQLGANGTGFFAVWTASVNYVVDVYGSRIDSSGTVLDPGGINISQGNSPAAYTHPPEVGWDGVNWRVTWDFNGVSVARVSVAGELLDAGGVAVPVSEYGPTAVAPGGAIQIVWDALAVQESDVYAAAVSSAFDAGPERTLSLAAPSQTHVDLAGSGSGWMAVYRSEVSGERRIMAQPLDAGGTPLTATPVLLAGGDTTSGPSVPKVAWNGSLYLAVWSDQGAGNIVGRRILADGTPVDAAPFVIMSGGSPDVAALGNTFLVVGTEETIGPHFVHPFAIRVRGSDGALLDPAPFQLGQYFARVPAVVEVGGRWLVVWQRNVTHDDPAATTRGAFVNADGSFLPEFFIYGSYSTAGGNGIFELAAAASDNVALVVQSNEVSSGVETDLVGIPVNADGAVQPAVNLTPWQGNQYRPRLAWDGSNFILAYQEQKNRFAPHTLDQLDARSDLFGMRIDETGAKRDTDGFVFSNSPLGETHPDVAAANGISLFAGSLLRNEAPFATYRVGYELFDRTSNEWPVAVAAAAVTKGDVPLAVTFSAAGSGDPDGSLSSYLWDFGDGASSSEANPSHTYMATGKYLVTLTVTDNEGATSTNTVAVEVTPINQPPVAVASSDVTSGPAPLSVEVSATGSYDPDGPLGNIHWDFGDGSTYWGSPGYHTYATPGTYEVTLTVWDSRGATDSDSLIITVGIANQAPVAAAGATPLSGPAPLQVAFSSAGSNDPDGSIASYRWEFGDGATSTAPNPSHTYNNSGTYVATLTVTDDAGAMGSDSVTITASAPQMVVDGIVVTIAERGKWKEAAATVRIVDVNNAPIEGATVTGDFAGATSGSASGSTDANGEVTLSSPRSRDGSYWQFCVTGVTKAGWAYTPGAADCGESGSGTSNAPPNVTVTNPTDGATVAGTVAVQIDAGDAEDPAGSLTVEWNLDGGAWQPAAYNSATSRYEAPWDTAATGNGSHTIDVRATDSAGAVATDSSTVTVDNGGSTDGIYIGNLSGAAIDDGANWIAQVTLTVLDSAGSPVAGATVGGSWSKGALAMGSCTTDAGGQCTVEQTGLKKNVHHVTFTVEAVEHSVLLYDPSLNLTSEIRVVRP